MIQIRLIFVFILALLAVSCDRTKVEVTDDMDKQEDVIAEDSRAETMKLQVISDYGQSEQVVADEATPATVKSPMGEIVCPGSYGGHLQGITTDDAKAIYWSFTTDLVKTDSEGKLLNRITVPNHHGDLTYHDGKIYVAVNLGKFNREEGHARSWVYVYDAEKLDLLSKHSIPEVVHGAGGIDYHNNRFYIVGGLPEGYDENYVYEYDEGFEFLKKHTIKSGYTRLGIQTACYAQGYWWFGCSGNPRTLLKTDESFELLGKYDFDGALGICRFSDDELLIGRDPDNQDCRGQVVSAKQDQTKGLIIVEEKSDTSEEPTR